MFPPYLDNDTNVTRYLRQIKGAFDELIIELVVAQPFFTLNLPNFFRCNLFAILSVANAALFSKQSAPLSFNERMFENIWQV